MAALLKEAFSGLAVEMNEGFCSLGALLKVKNNAKGDDNAPALSDPESDDHDSGSDKESEEPARKKQKTDDRVVLSKDNSDILKKLEKEFNVSVIAGKRRPHISSTQHLLMFSSWSRRTFHNTLQCPIS